jgi:hypothetical protein
MAIEYSLLSHSVSFFLSFCGLFKMNSIRQFLDPNLVEPQKPVVQQTNYAETYGSNKKQSSSSVRPVPQNPSPVQAAPVKRPNPGGIKSRGPISASTPKSRGPAPTFGPKSGTFFKSQFL